MANMTSELPTPGKGYVLREHLGGGYWKDAYRGVSRLRMQDVALLTYKDDEAVKQMGKDFKIWLKIRDAEYIEYLSVFYEVFTGDDGKVYFVEELLSRPLERLAPLRSGEKFLRIARDLCRGLQCLHSLSLVHRDLKLDNCGIGISDRAKIFDLGSATSEPGTIGGTILTRAPELFQRSAAHTAASDIWSMGATLYALRKKDYPFVGDEEVVQRRKLNDDRKSGVITEQDAGKRKTDLDLRISRRYNHDDAEEALRNRISATLPGEPSSVLARMLSFAPADRPTAEECAKMWDSLVINWVSQPAETIPLEQGDDEALRVASSLESYLNAVVSDRVTMTDKQWDRIPDALKHLRDQLGDESAIYNKINSLATQAKEKRFSA